MKWHVQTPSGDTRQVDLSDSDESTLADIAVYVDQCVLSMLPPGTTLAPLPYFTEDMVRLA